MIILSRPVLLKLKRVRVVIVRYFDRQLFRLVSFLICTLVCENVNNIIFLPGNIVSNF